MCVFSLLFILFLFYLIIGTHVLATAYAKVYEWDRGLVFGGSLSCEGLEDEEGNDSSHGSYYSFCCKMDGLTPKKLADA